MANYQIDSIRKPDRLSPYHSITHVSGPKPDGSGRWLDTMENIVKMIDSNLHRFYTKVSGNTAEVGTREGPSGRKHLQTYADGKWNDNLLSLPEC